MKTSMNLAIAFILGLLVALSLQPSQAATKTYDAVKLAEYSACLSQASGTYADPIYDQTNPQRVHYASDNTIDKYIAWCAPYKPK
jgi:hypothetical protein